MKLIPKYGQIKLISHKLFEGIADKNETVKPMPVSEARETLKELGYQKVSEVKEDGATVEIWELPEHLQTK